MPASEEFYRDQNRLHVAFALTALAMLGATVWMLAADHYKPWKQYQRQFVEIKQNKLFQDFKQREREVDYAKRSELERKLTDAEAATASSVDRRGELESSVKKLKLDQLKQERVSQFRKANLTEKMSTRDLLVKQIAEAQMAHHSGPPRHDAVDERHEELSRKLKDTEAEVAQLAKELDESQRLQETATTAVAAAEQELVALDAEIVRLKDEVKSLGAAVDKAKLSLDSAKFGASENFRAMPILDAFASPTRIKQVVLEQLPLDYNFKMVTRFDRCMTCHLGMDSPGYTPENGVKEPFCSHPMLDLYVGSNSPHPVEKFGCTACHRGQGSATDFDWASHTPEDSKQREDWTKEHGWFYNHFHEEPMLPARFTQASCLKCHHDVYQIAQAAPKVTMGYDVIQTQGCYGCHEINGYKNDEIAIGPNLRIAQPGDSPIAIDRSLRKVGPSLMKVSQKLDEDFIGKWVRNPQAFRPTSKMPKFYQQLDEGFFGKGPAGEFEHEHALADLAVTEIHAVAKTLMTRSEAGLKGETVPKAPAGDAARGKDLFGSKGCVACHNHKEFASLQKVNFGPDLSEVGAKFQSEEQYNWLTAWIRDPASYHPQTYMPSLQLEEQAAADIATYLRSVPGQWAVEVSLPELDKGALRDMVLMFMMKGATKQDALERLDGKRDANGDFVKDDKGEPVSPGMSVDEQLLYLGDKTLGRLGCFGCHNIPGFESAKPIGTALNDWGKKDVHKLAFENVPEYVAGKLEAAKDGTLPASETGFYEYYEKNDYYPWAIQGHFREGFLIQKLREPRSYDYDKIVRWEDRTRMPKFNINDDERDAVATFVLGLVAEQVSRKYVYSPGIAKEAEVAGRRLLEKYNCVACHVIKPGSYQATPEFNKEKYNEFRDNLVESAKQATAADYKFNHPAYVDSKPLQKNGLTFHGLPFGVEEADAEEDPRTFVSLWAATKVGDEVSMPAGEMVGIPQSLYSAKLSAPPYGGAYAMWLADRLIPEGKGADVSERKKAWTQVPPPLVREGEKVQTDWLFAFLSDPVLIRPAAKLRMPKFNYDVGDVQSLANYFAAADGKPFPYFESEARESAYLTEMERKHPEYLAEAYLLITEKVLLDADGKPRLDDQGVPVRHKVCTACHELGGYRATNEAIQQGPMLRRAQERLRPEWMLLWISNPVRLVPYTGMPVNFPSDKEQYQEVFKGSGADQVRAARDALANYQRIVEKQLVSQQAPAAEATKKEAGGND